MTFKEPQVVDVRDVPYDVYIGRRMPSFEQSLLCNPYAIKDGVTRAQVLASFEAYARNRLQTDASFRAAILALEGKRIGCWCRGLPCHGHILVRLLRELRGIPDSDTTPNQGELF